MPETERCESGCTTPVTEHDCNGVPLCKDCYEALIAEDPDHACPNCDSNFRYEDERQFATKPTLA